MALYATQDQIQSFAMEANAHSFDAWEILVDGASRLFDNLVEVRDGFFDAAPVPAAYTARTFYGNGTGYLQIDPYTALNPVDPIVVDPANAYDIPDYAERDGLLVLYGSYTDRFVGWNDGVMVTVSANWGFPEVPKDVVVAVCQIAVHQWRKSDPAFTQISNAEGAQFEQGIPSMAQAAVNKYREKYSQRALFV